MDEKGSEEALGMDDEVEVADKPRKAVTYAGRIAESSMTEEKKSSVLEKLKEKQAHIAANPTKKVQSKKREQEL